MLHRDILVLHLFCLVFCVHQSLIQRLGSIESGITGYLGIAGDDAFRSGQKIGGIYRHLNKNLRDQSAALIQKGIEQVTLLDLTVLIADRGILCLLYGFQGFLSKFFGVHRIPPFIRE